MGDRELLRVLEQGSDRLAGEQMKLMLALTVLFISVWVKTLAPVERPEGAANRRALLSPGTMASQGPL